MARFISATTLLLAVALFASAAHAATGLLNSTGSSVNKLDTGLHGECPANQTLIGMLQKYYPTSGIKLPEETQVTNCVTTQDANRNEAYTVSFDMKGVTCEIKLTAAEVNTFNNEFGYDREVARKVLACHFALALKEHEPVMTAEEKKKQKKKEQRKRNAENNKQKEIDRANQEQCKSDAAVFAQIKALYVAKHESGAQNYELALHKIALENNNCKVINADKEGGEYTLKLKDKPCKVIALRDTGAESFTAAQRSELETGLDACVKTMTENIARKAEEDAKRKADKNAASESFKSVESPADSRIESPGESSIESPVISRDEYIIEDETEEFLRNERLANASTVEKKFNDVELTADEKKKQKRKEQKKRNAENNKQKKIDRANKAQCKSDAAVFAQIKALYVAKHESGAQNYELALERIALENDDCDVINVDQEGGQYTLKLKDKPCKVVAQRDIGADSFTAAQRNELEAGLDACVKTMTENIARRAEKKANKGALNNAESPVETSVDRKDEFTIEDETEEFLRSEREANASTVEEVNQIEEEAVEEVNQVDEEAVEEVNNEVSAQTAEFDEEKSEDLNTSVDTVQKKKEKKKTPRVIPGDCENPREMYKFIENMYESKKASSDQLYKLALGSLNMTLKSCTVDDVNQDGGVMKISVKDRSCFVHVHKDHGAEQMNAAQSKQLKEDLDDCLSTMHKALRAKKTLANQQSKVKRQAKRRNNKAQSADTSVVEESSAPVVEEPVVEEPVVTAAATEEANEENDFNIENTNDAVDIDEEDDDIHRVFDAAEQAGRENNTYGGLQCNNMPHVRYLLRDTAAAVGLALPSDLEITTCKVTTVNDAMIFRFGFGEEECPVVMRLKSGNSEAFASDKSRDEFKKDMKKCALKFTNSECGNHEKMRDAFKQEYVKLGGNADKNFHIERCVADAANQKGGVLSMKLDQVECDVRVSAELATNPATADRTDFTAYAQICLNKVKAQAEAKRIADNKAKKENKKAKKAEAKAQVPAPQHSRVGGFSDVTKDNIKEVQKIFAHLALRKLIKSIIVTKQNVKSVQTQVVAGTNVKAVLSFNGKQCELQVFQPLTAKDAPMKVNVYHDNAAKADGEVFHTTLGHSKFELPNCIDVLPTENAQNMLKNGN